jgi:pyruvate dehydrogenase E2 component (dihydrolipoamide acetyltransferase)
MRKTIARRLTEARQTVPQFYLTMDCEIDALLALREQVNKAAPKDKEGKPAWKVSVNDMAIKALAMALMRVPDANVTFTEGGMLKHKHAMSASPWRSPATASSPPSSARRRPRRSRRSPAR